MIRSPAQSKRVAIGEIVVGVALVIYGIVSHVWFAYIVAVLAILFGIFVWVRASSGEGGSGGNGGAFRS
jgi:hypothetical protein